MTSLTLAKPTSANVANLATQSVSLDRTALLGIFGQNGNLHALLRVNARQILRVSVGDRFGNTTVTAIGEDAIALRKGSRDTGLRMPQS